MFDQLHLLDHMPVVQRNQLSWGLEFVVDRLIDPLGGKRFTFMLGMTALTADLSLATMRRRRLGRLDDIARRWLGGIRRILLEPRDLRL